MLSVGTLDQTMLHMVLLEDTQKVKVLCDVHQAATWLDAFGLNDVLLRKCVDLQLLYEDLVDNKVRMTTMETIMGYCGPAVASLAHFLTTHSEWMGEARVTSQGVKGAGVPQYEKTKDPESDDLLVSISAMAAYVSMSTEEIRREAYLKRT